MFSTNVKLSNVTMLNVKCQKTGSWRNSVVLTKIFGNMEEYTENRIAPKISRDRNLASSHKTENQIRLHRSVTRSQVRSCSVLFSDTDTQPSPAHPRLNVQRSRSPLPTDKIRVRPDKTKTSLGRPRQNAHPLSRAVSRPRRKPPESS